MYVLYRCFAARLINSAMQIVCKMKAWLFQEHMTMNGIGKIGKIFILRSLSSKLAILAEKDQSNVHNSWQLMHWETLKQDNYNTSPMPDHNCNSNCQVIHTLHFGEFSEFSTLRVKTVLETLHMKLTSVLSYPWIILSLWPKSPLLWCWEQAYTGKLSDAQLHIHKTCQTISTCVFIS